MDLSPIHLRMMNAFKTTPQAVDSVTLEVLDKRLAGQMLLAHINKEISLSPQLRQSIVQAINNESAAGGDSPPAPITALLASKVLKVFSVDLLLPQGIALPAETTIPKQTMLLSSLTLPLRQTIELLIRSDGHLQLHDTKTTQQNQQQAIIQQALREYLPPGTSSAGQKGLTTLTALWQGLSTLREDQRDLFIAEKDWQTLSKLVDTVSVPAGRLNAQPILNSETLKGLLANSGNYLEPKVAIASQKAAGHSLSPSGLEDDLKYLLTQLFLQTKATDNPSSVKGTEEAPGSLRQALGVVAAQMRSLNQLTDMIQQFRTGNPLIVEKQVNATKLRQLLNAASALGLARISTHQLQQLLHSVESRQSGVLQSFDIPLRLNDQIYPLHLQIQEHIRQPEEKENKESSEKQHQSVKKSSRWQIFLELQLPDDGWFAAEISVDEAHVSTRFWSESSDIALRTRKRLKQLQYTLERCGLSVDDMRMESGPPPARRQPIIKTLVDVRT